MPLDPSTRLRVNKKIAIIYHGDCLDGFGAAWAAWKKFGSKAEYYPVHHRAPALPLKGKTVYFLDIVYRGAALKKIIKDNKQVTALDHHITTKADVEMTADYRYALDHSGAALSFKYFHPGKKMPMVIRHIEDVDIWRHALRRSPEVTTALKLLPFDFKVWDKFILKYETPDGRRRTLNQGVLLKRFEESLVARIIADGAYKVKFEGHKVYAVNAPHLWATEIGHSLYEKLPPFAIVWRQKQGSIKVSLRGTGSPDLAKIAEKFGGGGHKGASGFSVPANKLPWRRL